MPMTNLQYWDIKYYYQIHCERQRSMDLTPVTYAAFRKRVKKMNLHDAIYMPRVEYNVRDMKKIMERPIQDEIRRKQINKEENIPVLDFEQIDKALFNKRDYKIMANYNMKPKKSLFQRIIWWIKEKWMN